MGPRLLKELDELDRSMNDPLRPLVAVIGGDDAPAKLRTVRHLVTRADRILIGGAVAFTFLEAQGVEVGLSVSGQDLLTEAQEVLEMAEEEGTSLILPTDVIMARSRDEDAEGEVVSVRDINPRWMGLDIGPGTVDHFLAAIRDAKTIIWNGTMGAWESDQFAQGTMALAFAIANSHAYSVVGGRGTVSALERSGEAGKACHVSLGGDAFKELLSGEHLPGAETLGWRCREPL
jgi:phosphoglycerate kinase